jgi:hypothetical protein
VLAAYAAFFDLWPDSSTWLKPHEIIQYAKNMADTRNSPDLLELLKNYVGRGRHQQHQKLGWWLKRGTGHVIYGKRLLVRAVGSHQKEYCVVDV